MDNLLGRIEINEQIMVGKPVIGGTRLTQEPMSLWAKLTPAQRSQELGSWVAGLPS